MFTLNSGSRGRTPSSLSGEGSGAYSVFYQYEVDRYREGQPENGRIEIVSDHPRRLEVLVYYQSKYGEKTPTAEINWSAIGSTDPDTASLYARMIQLAVLVAKDLEAHGSIDHAAKASGQLPSERHIARAEQLRKYLETHPEDR